MVDQLGESIREAEAFHAWLEDFSAVEDDQRLLRRLSHSREALPGELRKRLGLPLGSSYGDAARLFLATWGLK